MIVSANSLRMGAVLSLAPWPMHTPMAATGTTDQYRIHVHRTVDGHSMITCIGSRRPTRTARGGEGRRLDTRYEVLSLSRTTADADIILITEFKNWRPDHLGGKLDQVSAKAKVGGRRQ